MREELQQEIVTREQVVFWLQSMKELDLTIDDNKRILIDTFVNSIVAFDDKLIVGFNNHKGANEIALLNGGCSISEGLGEPFRTNPNCLNGGSDLFLFYPGKAMIGLVVGL